jgi:hypothetical protein
MKRLASIAVALAVVLGACGDTTEPRVPTSLQVSTQSVTMEVGDTVRINAHIADQHGNAFDTPPAGHTIAWSSSNNNVVTVSGGLLTAVGMGSAVVTASAGALTPREINVQVTGPAMPMQLSFSYSGHRSGTFSVTATAFDPEGSFALSFYDTDYVSQDVLAQRRRTTSVYDFFHFWVDGNPITTTGTRDISDGYFILGFNVNTESWDAVYQVVSGSVNFTTVTSERMVGTFSVVMEEMDTGATLNVTSGTFDVPNVGDLSGDTAASVATQGTPVFGLPQGRLERFAPLQR